jgi:1-acyl-sn-glycerol-3-phosphate acyltransferase
MLIRIKQGFKILTSGFLFTCLGVGGILCTLLYRPILALHPGGAVARRRAAGRAIHRFFRLFAFGLEGSGILRIETEGLPEGQDRAGALLLANHPSYLDIVLLIALLPDTVCIVKEGVWNNPFFGPLVRAAGYIPNGAPEEVLERGLEALGEGRALVIFPEGTRTSPGVPLRFHRGAAHLALRTGAPVIPIAITVDPPLLAKGNRWYHVPAPTCVFRFKAGPRMQARQVPGPEDAPDSLKARAFTRALEAHFTKETHAPERIPA